ncbi:hypothetical protein KCP71_00945 [Salmonella enterica subsp. enterica]|nr:hypothetical protein KCP71_00945 [Salmonella enterica subsp. enterica]
MSERRLPAPGALLRVAGYRRPGAETDAVSIFDWAKADIGQVKYWKESDPRLMTVWRVWPKDMGESGRQMELVTGLTHQVAWQEPLNQLRRHVVAAGFVDQVRFTREPA